MAAVREQPINVVADGMAPKLDPAMAAISGLAVVEGAGRQTWKLSPQPQRPDSLGFLNTKPVWNCSST